LLCTVVFHDELPFLIYQRVCVISLFSLSLSLSLSLFLSLSLSFFSSLLLSPPFRIHGSIILTLLSSCDADVTLQEKRISGELYPMSGLSPSSNEVDNEIMGRCEQKPDPVKRQQTMQSSNGLLYEICARCHMMAR